MNVQSLGLTPKMVRIAVGLAMMAMATLTLNARCGSEEPTSSEYAAFAHNFDDLSFSATYSLAATVDGKPLDATVVWVQDPLLGTRSEVKTFDRTVTYIGTSDSQSYCVTDSSAELACVALPSFASNAPDSLSELTVADSPAREDTVNGWDATCFRMETGASPLEELCFAEEGLVARSNGFVANSVLLNAMLEVVGNQISLPQIIPGRDDVLLELKSATLQPPAAALFQPPVTPVSCGVPCVRPD